MCIFRKEAEYRLEENTQRRTLIAKKIQEYDEYRAKLVARGNADDASRQLTEIDETVRGFRNELEYRDKKIEEIAVSLSQCAKSLQAWPSASVEDAQELLEKYSTKIVKYRQNQRLCARKMVELQEQNNDLQLQLKTHAREVADRAERDSHNFSMDLDHLRDKVLAFEEQQSVREKAIEELTKEVSDRDAAIVELENAVSGKEGENATMSEKLGMMNLKLERVVAESRVSQEKVTHEVAERIKEEEEEREALARENERLLIQIENLKNYTARHHDIHTVSVSRSSLAPVDGIDRLDSVRRANSFERPFPSVDSRGENPD